MGEILEKGVAKPVIPPVDNNKKIMFLGLV
jgi:hypothetical protein